jgi:hypothetical protein
MLSNNRYSYHSEKAKTLQRFTQINSKKQLSSSLTSWLMTSCLKWISPPVYSKRVLKYLTFGILSTALTAIPALGAERIAFSTHPLEIFIFLEML